ncbi:metallophosphoesterase family protein [soil metagenome]
MRIVLLSDIHCNLPALEAVVADLAQQSVDQVVTLGDHLSGPLLAAATARFLMARTDWLQLAGNHERYLLNPDRSQLGLSDGHARDQIGSEVLTWIAALEPCRQFDAELLLCHGTPTHDDRYLLETIAADGLREATDDEIDRRLGAAAATVVACGHSHLPRDRRVRDRRLVNPGSVGLQAYEDDEPFVHRIENGTPAARYAILDHTPTGWTCELRSIDYDHRAMAELALTNGRPEWARALATGRLSS